MVSQQHITLSQLQRSIHETLAERFSMPIWVSAEVADIKVNGSGHCYMELVEKGESDGISRAQARAVIWRGAYADIARRFESETGERLSRGITILAKVVVTYHELYGLSLQVSDIDPTYTIGEVERERLAAIAKLKSNGSWDVNRSLTLPMLTQRIAIISAKQAAGYQDFIRELGAGGYLFCQTLFEATMQGAAAEASIIEALIAIANRREEFDAVVVIRGGGSANDLRCFDSYRLALHFARFPLPVVSGIGHDKDTSVVDMVAHTSLKTPTAVAGWLTERMATLDGWLQSAALELHRYTAELTREIHILLESISKEIETRCEERLNRERREVEERLAQVRELTINTLSNRSKQIELAASIIDGYSPERLIEVGFAIVRQRDRAISSVKGLSRGEELQISLRDGELTTEIKEVKQY